MKPGSRTLTGRHVLMIFLAMFGVIIAVNGVFTYLALETFPGLVSDDAYHHGLEYNKTLADADAQHARGWTSALVFKPGGARRGVVTLSIKGHDGAPVTGLQVTGQLRRPARRDLDRAIALSETDGGVYTLPLELPLAGNWDIRLVGERGGQKIWRLRERLWVE